MSEYIKYEVRVYPNGSKHWYLNGKLHSEDEFNSRNKSSCDGKVVEIDGKKYELKAVR